jgi:energy-coupling factor transporter ATP-binding protein EcfA2
MSNLNKNIYDFTSDCDLNIKQFYYDMYNILPSELENNIKYTDKIFTVFFNEEVYKLLLTEKTKSKYRENELYLFQHKYNQIIFFIEKVYTKTPLDKNYSLKVFYEQSKVEIIETIINDLKQYKVETIKSNISIITSSNGILDIEDFDLDVKPIDIALNYGKDFLPAHNVIVNKLNETNSKGIVLLHGTPGCGKTTYIKYLTTLIPNKDIIFIPPSFAESLAEPSIVPFLMNYKNSILIIEDAEKVISEREFNGSSTAVSNLLNLTDGLLGDCLNIQVIATFNMKKEKIDKALLRKGRLICEYEFGELSVEDSNNLLIALNKDYRTDVKMTLSDIYYIDEDLIKVNKKTKKIGL